MAEATKYAPLNDQTLITDLASHFSLSKTKRTITCAYAFIFIFLAFTIFLAFSPSSNSSSPWFNNIFTTTSFSITISNTSTDETYGSQFSSIVSYFFPNSSTQVDNSSTTIFRSPKTVLNNTVPTVMPTHEASNLNKTVNITHHSIEANKELSFFKNESIVGSFVNSSQVVPSNKNDNSIAEKGAIKNQKNESNSDNVWAKQKQGIKDLLNCNLYDGNWVKDESYPLYKPGSCSLIDEQFNCFLNGRPDSNYFKLKWKPKGCTIPRLNGTHMLELLRGKRLVFVGDSLNRNMWESLVCILRNSVKDQTKVYEESGRHNFRSEPSYTFIFEEYNCRVEFFVSPFLVQPWEVSEKDGTKKETLRLDLIGVSADKYKTADILIFNTGHWWTHDKTSKGKDYYQEGSHVYNELNVDEAFRKAITTWGRWVDANVNPLKTHVMFRGYSASHFSGGQWNSGGACDSETEPIKNETYLTKYPTKMMVLEKVFKGMKSSVSYLNITRMTDYRKDGHPSVYRKLHLSEEERKSPLMFQDCSHWCLPGVPDSWNELLYAEMLVKQLKKDEHL